MKVEENRKKEFIPINIVIETRADLDTMVSFLYGCSTLSPLQLIYEQLRDISDNLERKI